MDTTSAPWPQGVGVVKPMDQGPTPTTNTNMLERRTRPQKDQVLNCPRCNSTNTKFCYYNNYSLSQPRYFCKTCRRYWTEGGSLRNVPVGGGSRKNKRSSNTSSSSKKFPDSNTPNFPHSASQNPKILEGQDLNLAYPPSSTDHQDYVNLSKYVEVPNFITDHTHNQNPNPSTSISTPSHHISAMELLKNTAINSRGLTSFMSSIDPNSMFSTGFPLQLKPTLNFSFEGFESGYGNNIQGVHETGNARLLFPMEDMKQVPTNTEFDQNNRGQGDHSTTTGYWNGMLGGGSW